MYSVETQLIHTTYYSTKGNMFQFLLNHHQANLTHLDFIY
jgi:hypothetical protein